MASPVLSVDDWISKVDHRDAKFLANTNMSTDGAGKIKCTLTLFHNGNYVSGSGYADLTGEAFLNAVEQIEKTIGRAWRNEA